MRILIADDDDVSRLELEGLLCRHGHEVVAVADGAEAWAVLQGDDPPRLAILDWLMESFDGVEVCRRVRGRPELRDVYLILLTSRGDQEHILEGFQAGANDYVTKPFGREELLARVRVGAQLVGLQIELAARVRELDVLATIDGLTGIANRRTFQARLEAECSRAARYGLPLALMLIDVDHFKSFNDAYGHPAGDDVLARMGRLLSSDCRTTDLVARYGGEEFAVILVNTDSAAANEATERLRTRIHAEPWAHRAVEVSIGIACCGPGAEAASELIGLADRALYFSKKLGRNRATHYGPDGEFVQTEETLDSPHEAVGHRAAQSTFAVEDATCGS
jgi:two-component system, cell cycle response regulator